MNNSPFLLILIIISHTCDFVNIFTQYYKTVMITTFFDFKPFAARSYLRLCLQQSCLFGICKGSALDPVKALP